VSFDAILTSHISVNLMFLQFICHGLESWASGPLRPTRRIHYLVQIRLGLGFDCLGVKSPLSI
jgi:hypothetical protein